VGTKVRASVAGGGAAAGTAGEVSGHTPDAKVEVRFKEGAAALAVASLRVAELPAGWAAGEKCFSALTGTVGGTELAVGQEGQVVGWSEPFDCDRIAVEFNGRRVNVLNSEIQSVSRCSGRKGRAIDFLSCSFFNARSHLLYPWHVTNGFLCLFGAIGSSSSSSGGGGSSGSSGSSSGGGSSGSSSGIPPL
jgi:uncharacterized membrane protein YgcG